MRATYVPGPAAALGVARLALDAPAGLAAGGEVTVYLRSGRVVRAALPAGQVRDVLRRWTAAARAGLGQLDVGE